MWHATGILCYIMWWIDVAGGACISFGGSNVDFVAAGVAFCYYEAGQWCTI